MYEFTSSGFLPKETVNSRLTQSVSEVETVSPQKTPNTKPRSFRILFLSGLVLVGLASISSNNDIEQVPFDRIVVGQTYIGPSTFDFKAGIHVTCDVDASKHSQLKATETDVLYSSQGQILGGATGNTYINFGSLSCREAKQEFINDRESENGMAYNVELGVGFEYTMIRNLTGRLDPRIGTTYNRTIDSAEQRNVPIVQVEPIPQANFDPLPPIHT